MPDLDLMLRDGRPFAVAPRLFVGFPAWIYASDPPDDWLVADGAAILVASYPALATAIYCGNANNGTAAWGYRTTSNVAPASNRSTSGAYIVLPDARDRYVRGWTDGGSHGLWSYFDDMVGPHTHPYLRGANLGAFFANGTGGQFFYTYSSATTSSNSGTETRPRTIMALPIIYAGP